MNINSFLITLSEEFGSKNYGWDKLVTFLIAIVQAVLIGIITSLVLNNSFKKSKALGDRLRKVGIEEIKVTDGRLNSKSRRMLFAKDKEDIPYELDLFFITGIGFFNDYYDKLIHLVENGTKIKVLIESPYKSVCYNEDTIKYVDGIEKFPIANNLPEDLYNKITKIYTDLDTCIGEKYQNLSYVDKTFLLLMKGSEDKVDKKYGCHSLEVLLVTKMLQEINKHAKSKNKIELHYYEDDYRIPITLGKFKAKGSKKTVDYNILWTNINSPIQETSKRNSINVQAKYEDENDKKNYAFDVGMFFDYIFEKYPTNIIK